MKARPIEGGVRRMRRGWRIAAIVGAVVVAAAGWQPGGMQAQAPAAATGVKYAPINPADLKLWLTYLSSDQLQGREVFSEGYGLAAAYIADHLRSWGVKPLGEDGTYFQTVKLKGYKVTRSSSVSVASGAETKTFKHGDHVTFNVNSGGRQTLTFNGAEFVGYGQAEDFQGRDVKGKLVIWMPTLGPAASGARPRGNPNALALNSYGAAAVLRLLPAPPAQTAAAVALTQAQEALQKAADAVQQAQAQLPGRAGRAGLFTGRGRAAAPVPDLITVARVDAPLPPVMTADETFFEALFAGAPVKFADLKARAEKGDSLAAASIPGAITINIDNTFEVISEQLTRNVVGMVEGNDRALKDTYVLFGAHLDHVGYSQRGFGAPPTKAACRTRSAASQAAIALAGKAVQKPGNTNRGNDAAATPPPFDQRDIIYNGADDDGSGSIAELAIAKAFATGPKPKRSVVFLWHTGEEADLYGSEFNADFPVVPLGKVQAQLNIDMVGRDDCDDLEADYTNSVFVVGADRISTDLHNLIVDTNAAMSTPLTLDYELNDAADPENLYTRSDHYSYAAKGIPIAFFTTGLHPDYHKVTDTVDKILFPKMARITALVYEAGFSIADTDRVLERDKKGPRTGLGSKAERIKK